MFVKICGVTSVDDALLAAGLGADAVGMIFAASPRRVTGADARDIVRRLPPEVLAVGVFRDERREKVVEMANTVGLRAVQLHGSESPEDVRWIGERVPAVIRTLSIDDPALVSVDPAEWGPHRLMIDSPNPGSGMAFDWAKLARRVGDRPYILAGGLDAGNVAAAIEQLGPWGVDAASGTESAPGRKDPAKVRRFLAAARAAVPGRLAPPTPATMPRAPVPRASMSQEPADLDDHGHDPAPVRVDAVGTPGSRVTDGRRPFDWEEERS